MTRPATHIWRLLRWGRALARHGALRGIENDPNTPAQVKRLARIARLGTIQPREPDYAAAFQDIGPAAIKLGQSLATRPDLVGEVATHNLLSLQDSLPPVPFREIEAELVRSFDETVTNLFSLIDPDPIGSASIAQVHRAVTTDGREVAIKVLRPGIRERFAADIATLVSSALIFPASRRARVSAASRTTSCRAAVPAAVILLLVALTVLMVVRVLEPEERQ